MNTKNHNTSKVGGLSLCYSCAVWMMLATLDMTARSCFNQWRQPDARHQLKLLHLLLPNNVNIELQSEALRTYFLWGEVLIWKCFAGFEEYPSSCHFEGPTDRRIFSLLPRIGDLKKKKRKKKSFLLLFWVVRKGDPPMTLPSYINATFTGYRVIWYSVWIFTDLELFLFSLNALQIWWCHRGHFFLKLWRSTTFLTSLGEHIQATGP